MDDAVTLVSAVVIGGIFAASLTAKLQNYQEFVQAVRGFKLVPRRLTTRVSTVLLLSECAVVLLLIFGLSPIGRQAAVPGLLLATALLSIYLTALSIVQIRRQHVSCHCFGRESLQVSWYDVARNLALITCAMAGVASGGSPSRMPMADAVPMAISGLTVSLIIAHLHEVMETARRPLD